METRTIVVSLLIGIVVTAALLAGAGAALDPGAADRRPAARSAHRPAAVAVWSSIAARPAARRRRAGGDPARPLRQRFAGDRRRPDRRRRRGDRSSPSRSSARDLVPPLAAIAGWPLERAAPPARPPRARERPAQPEPYRGHRGGADDRPHPRHLRHRLRRRAEELGRPGRRRKLRRRAGDPEQRRLLARFPAARRRRHAKCRESSAVATIRAAQAKLLDGGAGARVSAPSRDVEKRSRSNGRRVDRRRCATCATTRRSSPTPSPPTTASNSGDSFRLLSQTRRRPSFEVVGEFDSKLDVFGSVLITQRAMAREFGQTQDTIDFVQAEAPGRPGRGPGDAHQGRRSRLPGGRSAEPAGTEGKPRRTGRPARQPRLRAAAPRDRDLALRHRQHAGALDPRTDPRAGDAAGDRHVAPPGADDDPLRGGDHGPDRGDPRHGARAWSSPP